MRATDGAPAAGRGQDAPPDITVEVERMLAEARAGEWQRVGGAATKLRGMIDRLPPGQRGEALRATAVGIERVTALAVAQRAEIGERLGAIRHGRRAAATYRANRGPG